MIFNSFSVITFLILWCTLLLRQIAWMYFFHTFLIFNPFNFYLFIYFYKLTFSFSSISFKIFIYILCLYTDDVFLFWRSRKATTIYEHNILSFHCRTFVPQISRNAHFYQCWYCRCIVHSIVHFLFNILHTIYNIQQICNYVSPFKILILVSSISITLVYFVTITIKNVSNN